MTATPPNVARRGYYTKAEAARALGVSRPTLDSYIRGGSLACRVRRSTKRAVISGEEIIKFWSNFYL